MFDITGDDIVQLNDADLRTLVARLALAELALRRAPRSAVTAGGPQDGADGGIDVRVELSAEPTDPDFVPRANAGFQVKKPDLAAKAIINEMRPGGVLRPSITTLAEAGGAYVIASSGADLTDSTLQRRRDAMREAVADHPAGANLFVDVYDRSRLATWVNQNPGVAAWLRRRSGRPLSGWSAIGTWRDLGVAADAGYLIDESLTLVDEREGATVLPIANGIVALREALSEPGRSVRLIGLSGLGKTRLVQALFEAGVGEGDPLDAGMAVYADYADATTPSAREMASRLVEDGGRALLIVDNCNAATHGQLAELCGRTGSQVNLLTVEYDIRDDQPERTEVFRLVAASDALIEAWLKRDFPDVSAADRGRIAKFSGGNFRVARALAGTLRPGEGLGRLRDQDLFERIFLQRNDPDQTLLLDAQMLSLFYSIDITEGPEGELAPLATFAGRTVQAMYGSLAELQARGVLQARDPAFGAARLDDALADPVLGDHFAFLQVVAGLNGPGVDRMLRAIERAGSLEKFRHLANIDSDGLPSADLVRLLDVIAGLPGGPVLGLDMVWRHFHRSRDEAVRPFDPLLVDRARHLLTRLRADDLGDRRDYPIRSVAKAVLAGPEGRDAARAVSQMIYAAHKERGGWQRNGRGLAEALFRTQPEVALDVLIDGDDGPVERLFESEPGRGSPLDKVPVETLLAWAELAPERRYARLGEVLSLFHKDQMDSAIGLNPVFTALLEQAPDKAAFLGDAYSRLHPNGWSGSLATILEHRLALLDGLPDHPDITAWRMQEGARVAKWIAGERQQEAEREESFE